MDDVRIFCPRCRWVPQPASRWICAKDVGGCGHRWNTFTTRGICPQCTWHWVITACLACQRFSPHEAWYHYPRPAKPTRAEVAGTSRVDTREPEPA